MCLLKWLFGKKNKNSSIIPTEKDIDEFEQIEELTEETGFPIQKLNALLTMLEIKGLVKQLPGNTYVLI